MAEMEQPVAKYVWSGMSGSGRLTLFESKVLVQSKWNNSYELDSTFLLERLTSLHTTVRFRRWRWILTMLLMVLVCGGLSLWIFFDSFDFSEFVFETHFGMAPLAATASLICAAVLIRRVTGYVFRFESGETAFTLYDVGRHRRECAPFVAELVRHIEAAKNEPGGIQSIDNSAVQNPIAEYRCRTLLTLAAFVLFESTIRVCWKLGSGSTFETSYALSGLASEYATFRYRRRQYYWSVTLAIMCAMLFLCFPYFPEFIATIWMIGSGVALLSSIVMAILNYPLVKCFLFLTESGARVLPIVERGPRRRDCEEFVKLVAQQIDQAKRRRS